MGTLATDFPTGAPTRQAKSLTDQALDKAEETAKGMAPIEVGGVVIAALCSIAGLLFAYWKYKAEKKKIKLEAENAEMEKKRIEAAKQKDVIEAQGYVIENERKVIEKQKADMERTSAMLDNKRKRLEIENMQKPSYRSNVNQERQAAVLAAAALKLKNNVEVGRLRKVAEEKAKQEAEKEQAAKEAAEKEAQEEKGAAPVVQLTANDRVLDTTGDGQHDSLASDTTGDGKIDKIVSLDQVESQLTTVTRNKPAGEQLMLVTVPAGAMGGQVIKVRLPNGTLMATTVPASLVAGHSFKMRVPAGASQGALQSSGISANSTMGPQHKFFHVTVPAGAQGGMNIDVLVPQKVAGHAGKTMTVQVPAGLSTGQMFKVPVDALG